MALSHLASQIAPAPAPVTDPDRIALTPEQIQHLRNGVEWGGDFLTSLYRQWSLKGWLSPRQVACIDRGIAEEADKAKPAAPAAATPNASPRPTYQVPLERLNAIFEHARRRGVNQPTIRLQTADTGYKVYAASALSSNAGALYVKDLDTGTYLGKIAPTGHWLAARGTDVAAVHADLLVLLADPELNARKYGAETGECSICGRLLTDPISIAQSMGPICAGRYGF